MSFIETELDDAGIWTLTLNRPEKLNALSMDVLGELDHCLEQAEQTSAIKGLLITGVGKAFCAGADIARLAECDALSGYCFAKFGQKVLNRFEALSKPSIAAINGYAFGGGCELAMATTLRIASDAAQFGQPEVRLGVIPGYGGTQRLSRLVGLGRAMDLCLTGRFIDAQTALSWGLITHLVSADTLLSSAKTLLMQILGMAPTAVLSTMNVIRTGYDMPLATALELEALAFAKACATADKQEGVQAFLSKRSPEFPGQ